MMHTEITKYNYIFSKYNYEKHIIFLSFTEMRNSLFYYSFASTVIINITTIKYYTNHKYCPSDIYLCFLYF